MNTSDRYEIRGKIGEGGVGAVYRAYDTQLRREVAMKRVLQDGEMNAEEATANLLKEATALSAVQHPHIVTIYDAGIDAEGPHVVMELINGKTLDEMVERGILTFEDFKEVAIQTQEAMIAAQELDLVHRDLKPSNVMVSWLPSGRFQVKIVDFGLAKFSAKPSLQTIDHGDAVFGSIFFMAPEQFERTPLDRRTDMYSLGAMYYYALAGEYPFNGETAPQVMAAHLQNKVKSLAEIRPDLPAWVSDWVMWHIRRSMDERPDSAREALERFLNYDAQATHGATATHPIQGATGGLPTQTAGQPILSPNGATNPHSVTQRLNTSAGVQQTQQYAQQGQHPQQQHPQQQHPQHPQQQPSPGMPGYNAAMNAGLPQKKSNTALIVVVAIVLIGLIIIVSIIIASNKGQNEDLENINALIENNLDTIKKADSKKKYL